MTPPIGPNSMSVGAAWKARTHMAICMAAMLLGCARSPGGIRITPVDPPGDFRSLGRTDVYVELRGTKGRATVVSVPLEARHAFFFLPETLRLARWDNQTQAFQVVPDSEYDLEAEAMNAVVDTDGIYTALGLSRIDRILAAQLAICRLVPRDRVWADCRKVLCLPPDSDDWGIDLPASLGQYQDDLLRELRGICAECIDAWRQGSYPECGLNPSTVDAEDVLESRPLDFDADGLSAKQELEVGTDSLDPDTDDDGLLDGWEVLGYSIDGDNGSKIDLPGRGVDPLRKDILVEVDWMFLDLNGDGDTLDDGEFSYRPDQAAIDYVVQAFAESPVKNPSPDTGINLVVDVSDGIPFVDLCNNLVVTDENGNQQFTEEYYSLKEEHMTPGMAGISRYCLWIRVFDSAGRTGQAEFPGPSDDFVVSLGGWIPPGGTQGVQQGTFMHELGHTLGLYHGGGPGPGSDRNFEPNYPSVMNYYHQYGGVVGEWTFGNSPLCSAGPLGCLGSDGEPDGFLCFMPNDVCMWTYSSGMLPDVDECKLSEEEGIHGLPGPIDWNFDGTFGSAPVSLDLQRDGEIDIQTDHDDWSNLVIPFWIEN